jgi:hypothetical protein
MGKMVDVEGNVLTGRKGDDEAVGESLSTVGESLPRFKG